MRKELEFWQKSQEDKENKDKDEAKEKEAEEGSDNK